MQNTPTFNAAELPEQSPGKLAFKWFFFATCSIVGFVSILIAYSNVQGPVPISLPLSLFLTVLDMVPTVIALIRKTRFRYMVIINLITTFIIRIIVNSDPSLFLLTFLPSFLIRGAIAIFGLKQYYR